MSVNWRLLVYGLLAFGVFALSAIFWWARSPYTAAGVSIVGLLVLGLSLFVFRPVRGSFRLRVMVLALWNAALILTVAGLDWRIELVQWLLLQVTGQHYALELFKLSEGSAILLMTFATVLVIVVFYSTRDQLVPAPEPAPRGSVLRGPQYHEQFMWAVDAIETFLTNLNIEAQWTESRYVELPATVKETAAGGQTGYVDDLATSLSQIGEREVRLVLGEPGSGKSVALRQLALQIADVARRRGVLPLYLNLREWPCPSTWTPEHPPTAEEVATHLWKWAKVEFGRQLAAPDADFIGQYADLMRRTGRLFFLLDSFDETSVLLGLPRENQLVLQLAKGVRGLFVGDARAAGVVASRYDRSPSRGLRAQKWYELQALDQGRLIELVRRYLRAPPASDQMPRRRPHRWWQRARATWSDWWRRDEFIWRAVRNDPRLGSLPRNPLEAALVAEYLRYCRDSNNRPIFPQTRADSYRHALERRLESVRNELSALELTRDQWRDALCQLAYSLYAEGRSLERLVSELPQGLRAILTDNVLEALTAARLLRLTQPVPGQSVSGERRVSFAHSRFSEFLAAQQWMKDDLVPPYEDIPTIGPWRDVLVVYYQVAPADEGHRLAKWCFCETKPLFLPNTLTGEIAFDRAARCLRFLVVAARDRREPLQDVSGQLFERLNSLIQDTDDWLRAVIAVQAAAVLPAEELSRVVWQALNRPNPWLHDEAFDACDYLPASDTLLLSQLRTVIQEGPSAGLLSPRWRGGRLLMRSPGLKSLARDYYARLGDTFGWLIACTWVAYLSKSWWVALIMMAVWTDCAFHWLRRRLSGKPGVKGEYLGRALVGLQVLVIEWPRFQVVERLAALLIIPIFPVVVRPTWWFPPFPTIAGEFFDFDKLRARILAWLPSFLRKVRSAFWMFLSFAAIYFFLEFIAGKLRRYSWGADLTGEQLFMILCGLFLGYGLIAVIVLYVRKSVGRWFCQIAAAWSFPARWQSDRRRFRQIVWPEDATTREWISREWLYLSTPTWRLKFVRRLAALRSVSGTWSVPNPYPNTDKASVLLQKLDRRWLNLEK